MTTPTSHFIDLEGLRLHYLEMGQGEPVLLLHGWPTSSFLWRNVMPPIAAAGNRVLALDLPGFGQSAKPLDVSYSLRFYERILDGFVAHLGARQIGLAVHDLGGPIGLYWASQGFDRVRSLALLNTLVYPEMSWAVVAFAMAARLPGWRHLLTSPWGLKKAMHIGVADPRRLAAETIDAVQAPFAERSARRALAMAGCNVSPKGIRQLASRLPSYSGPVRIIYGAKDRILPDVAQTMARLQKDLPQAEATVLDDCGHFLQEERPEEIGQMLGAFFAELPSPTAPA